MRVPVEMCHHLVAAREHRRALRVPAVRQMGERSAGVEFQLVVATSPGGTNLVGAVDQQRFQSAVTQTERNRDARRARTDHSNLMLAHTHLQRSTARICSSVDDPIAPADGPRPRPPQRVHRDIADVRRRQPPGLQGESTRDRGSSHKILNLICTTFDCRAAWLGLRVGSRRYGAGVQSLMFPSINLEGALSQLGADTFRRGVAYAREGRVIRCLWDPDACSLLGNVRGAAAAPTPPRFSCPEATDNWTVQLGLCSCPMQADCKHVAAIVVAAAGVTKTRGQRTPTAPSPPAAAVADALLPASSTNDAVTTPLAIELRMSQAGHSPTLDARLVRPGKRGGWVAR